MGPSLGTEAPPPKTPRTGPSSRRRGARGSWRSAMAKRHNPICTTCSWRRGHRCSLDPHGRHGPDLSWRYYPWKGATQVSVRLDPPFGSPPVPSHCHVVPPSVEIRILYG